jgi:ABC-type molybdenum transport system ATPase subunit/photorepair protein PhrA
MENVSWICDGRHILKNINWEVNPGEHWAIIGLNGSGMIRDILTESNLSDFFETSVDVEWHNKVWIKVHI